MEKIKIIVDSTCDLPREDIVANGIVVMPLNVIFGDETYKDGVNITTDLLYKLVEQRGELPKTSAINEAQFSDVFRSYIEEG